MRSIRALILFPIWLLLFHPTSPMVSAACAGGEAAGPAHALNTEAVEDQRFSYVGVSECARCHRSPKQGEQLRIWQESAHARAYITLMSEMADRICRQKGFGEKASKAEACLKCHVTGYNVDASLLGPDFNIEDGVQCESCHGPGSAYQSTKAMQSWQLAVQNGLVVHEQIEEFCRDCHNPESPILAWVHDTLGELAFNFDQMWAKIEHRVPKD